MTVHLDRDGMSRLVLWLCYNQTMDENTLSDHIIAFLLSARSTGLYKKILWERLQKRRKNLKPATFRQNLFRLRKKGIIADRGEVVCLSGGRALKRERGPRSIIKNSAPDGPEKILMSFDVPETKRRERDWLRNQLKFWNFEMIQKSLWFGQGPLPRDFNNRLKILGIFQNIRVFKIHKKQP